jgi:hypothetical protein
MTTQQCCEQTFNIVTYTNHNKVKSFDITPIPTAYTHILNLLSPHTLILKDKENNIHKYDMYKDIYLPLCNTPMFPNSSHTLLHTIPILGGVKNDTLIYVFSKTDSNIENLLFIHHVCTANIPTTWVILSGSIENSRLYIVVAHTLVSQTPQICTYSIQLNDTNATFVRFQDTDIVKEYTIVSSTVWDVDGSRFRWWCCGKIASSENILYVRDIHEVIHHHLPIIHVTSYNKTTRRILFVDISQALVEIIYSTDRKSHQTGTLCSNIQPRGCGAVLLSLCVILTSITVNGLLVIIYPTGKRWKLFVSFDYGNTWSTSHLSETVCLPHTTHFNITLENRLVWYTTQTGILSSVEISLPIQNVFVVVLQALQFW